MPRRVEHQLAEGIIRPPSLVPGTEAVVCVTNLDGLDVWWLGLAGLEGGSRPTHSLRKRWKPQAEAIRTELPWGQSHPGGAGPSPASSMVWTSRFCCRKPSPEGVVVSCGEFAIALNRQRCDVRTRTHNPSLAPTRSLRRRHLQHSGWNRHLERALEGKRGAQCDVCHLLTRLAVPGGESCVSPPSKTWVTAARLLRPRAGRRSGS